MKITSNEKYFIAEVPRRERILIKDLIAYRGMTFSLSSSTADNAVLFSTNPYALADLGEGVPRLHEIWQEIQHSRSKTSKSIYPMPEGKELRPYQIASLDYVVARRGGVLGDAPGLGKTPMAIVFANHFQCENVLVICPSSVRYQWAEEIRRWSTHPIQKISILEKVKNGIHPKANFQILSYDAARKPAVVRALLKRSWDLLICDEGHRMKNISSLTTRAILGNGHGFFEVDELKMRPISHACKMNLILTGTILQNRPAECFTIFRYLDYEGIDFMGWTEFKETFNKRAKLKTPEGKTFVLENTRNEQDLQNRLRSHIMTRHMKEDVMQQIKLPLYGVVEVGGTTAVKLALEAEGMLNLDIDDIGNIKNIEILGHIATVRKEMGVALAPLIAEYAKDFLEGSDEKLTIFAWHTEVLDIFCHQLKAYGVVRVDGKKTAKQKNEEVKKFKEQKDIRVFVGNMISAGVGVDGLQKVCSNCYLAEPDWTPGNNEQAVSRLWRMGQEGQVRADFFVAKGSISQKILTKALSKLKTIHRSLDYKE